MDERSLTVGHAWVTAVVNAVVALVHLASSVAEARRVNETDDMVLDRLTDNDLKGIFGNMPSWLLSTVVDHWRGAELSCRAGLRLERAV